MAPGFRHPLLGLRRCETHASAAPSASTRCDDPSNDDPAFVRNRVRHELLPLCAEVAGRDPVPLLARQAGVLRDEVELLDALAADAAARPGRRPRRRRARRVPLARRALRTWLRTRPDRVRRPAPPIRPRWPRSTGSSTSPPARRSAPSSSGGRRVRRTRGRLPGGPGRLR